jgi:Rad3-related DNA helicase
MFDLSKLTCSKGIWRTGQEQVCKDIINAFNSGKRIVVYQGPVGSGKSVVSSSVAHTIKDESATHITPQKFLQTQFVKDFPHWPDLKGRNAYPCYADGRCDCSNGPCKQEDKSSLEECKGNCYYFQQRGLVFNSKFSIYNFDSHICQGFTGEMPFYAFKTIDEAHNIEGKIINYLETVINSHQIRDLPFIQDTSSGALQQAITVVDKRRFIKTFELKAKNEKDQDLKEKLLGIARKLTTIMAIQDYDNWIFECFQASNSITWKIRPIYCGDHCERLLYKGADHLLLMSGTILDCDTFCRSIGVDPCDVQYIESPMLFPASIRPIRVVKDKFPFYYNNKNNYLPFIARHINRLLNKHPDERGIIHTHNNEIMYYIRDNVKSDRLLFKQDFEDAAEVIAEHSKQENGVLVSPSMHEGLDLIDDLGRFQIICKCPYPSLGDKRIKKIMADKTGNSYYQWLTNLKLYQSLGRINRHEKDFGVSYILDECASNRLCDGPDYIKEAIDYE